jgi:hypothetical protein
MNRQTFVYFYRYGFVFRILGWGLTVGGDKANPPLFSERYGLAKVWRCLGFRIKVLQP